MLSALSFLSYVIKPSGLSNTAAKSNNRMSPDLGEDKSCKRMNIFMGVRSTWSSKC